MLHERGVNSDVAQGERDIHLPLGESAKVVIGHECLKVHSATPGVTPVRISLLHQGL